jgi:hypothetical protein
VPRTRRLVRNLQILDPLFETLRQGESTPQRAPHRPRGGPQATPSASHSLQGRKQGVMGAGNANIAMQVPHAGPCLWVSDSMYFSQVSQSYDYDISCLIYGDEIILQVESQKDVAHEEMTAGDTNG